MKIKYEKPIKEIILPNGESDGYEAKEVIFDVDYDDRVKAIIYIYYSDCDFETFRMMIREFDIDLSDFIDDDEIKKELYEIYLQQCY